MDLYIHSPMRIDGVVLSLSTGKTLPFTFIYFRGKNNVMNLLTFMIKIKYMFLKLPEIK
jgi:hypothetical protein